VVSSTSKQALVHVPTEYDYLLEMSNRSKFMLALIIGRMKYLRDPVTLKRVKTDEKNLFNFASKEKEKGKSKPFEKINLIKDIRLWTDGNEIRLEMFTGNFYKTLKNDELLIPIIAFDENRSHYLESTGDQDHETSKKTLKKCEAPKKSSLYHTGQSLNLTHYKILRILSESDFSRTLLAINDNKKYIVIKYFRKWLLADEKAWPQLTALINS
jgi:serine/threonine protein kinase